MVCENLGCVIQFGKWISLDLNGSMDICVYIRTRKLKCIYLLQKNVPGFGH